MAFEDKKGIVVASPFKLQAEALLDVRQQVETIAERDRLVTLKAATAGLRVFVKENSTSYVYTGSKWDPLTTGAPYKHPTGDGNHHVPATGTTNSGKFLKAGATAGSESWQKIAASDITGLPTKLPNPQALKFTGAATATYDGSGAVTVNIPTTSKTNSQLTLQLNGGVTEGTNKFTFDGSAAKEVNITPASIGAAASSHTHPSSQITGLPTSLKNPYSLSIKTNGATAATYDGSAAKEVNITPSSIGAATSGHSHSVFKGASASAAGGTGFVPAPAIGEQSKFLRGDGTWQVVPLSLSALGVTASATELNYMKGVTSAVQTQLNGKASSSHTHNYAGSGSAGGSANSAVKLATARTINGISFDGTKNIDIPNNYSKQLTSEDLNELLTPGNYFGAGGNTVKNKPSSVDYFGLEVYRIASGPIAQKLHGNNNIIYYRVRDNASFGAWQKVYSAAAKPTAAEIGAAPSSHTHPASQITGLPTKLPNPQALKFTGAATATYDGSGAVTVNIPTAQASPYALTMQFNGGTTEDTNKFTFNGSVAKNVNITPALIGAAAASHTHAASQITGLPTSLKNPYALTVKTNGTSAAVYDGSVSKEVNITASSVGAAAASHGHSTFKGATTSAAGGTGFVPTPGVGENNKYLRGDGTWQPISLTLSALGVTASATELNYMKGVTSAVQTQLNGKAAASHTHPASQITGIPTKLSNPYALKFTGAATATYDGSGAVTVNIPTAQVSPYALTMQFNGGTTEDTNKFTFNGGSAKTVNITPAAIGAAAASHSHSGYAPTSHTHNYAGSGSAGGSANSAIKLATARTINGISFDGTKNIEIPNSYSKQLTSEDLNSLLTPGNYFAAGGNTVKNKPSSVEHFGLEVYRIAGGNIAQKLHGSDNIIYYRFHNGTSFNSWSEIYSSVNKPTPSEIGAAAASHTHNYAASSHTHPASQITGLPTSLKNPYALTVKTNGTTAATYDGSAAKEVNITPAAIGAAAKSHSHSGYAPTSHTHNYAGSSSAGGPANSAKKVDFPVGTVLWTTSSSATFFSSTCGGTWEVLGNIDTIINSSTTLTLYMHKKKAL